MAHSSRRLRLPICLAYIALIACPAPASAEDGFGLTAKFKEARSEFKVVRLSPEIVRVTGRIVADDEKRFKSALSDETRTLIVNSGGGDVAPALAMADEIRRRGLRVVVDGACVSSCANYLFVAGKQQLVTPNSIVLWHGGASEAMAQEMAEGVRQALKEAKVPDAQIAGNVERIVQDLRASIARQDQLYRQIGLTTDILENLASMTPDARPVDGRKKDDGAQEFLFIPYSTLQCAGLSGLATSWEPADETDWRRFKHQAGMERLSILRSATLERRLCARR